MLAAAGFAKQDVQVWLMEHCGRTGADLRRAGKNGYPSTSETLNLRDSPNI
jgi:hypothetical protein